MRAKRYSYFLSFFNIHVIKSDDEGVRVPRSFHLVNSFDFFSTLNGLLLFLILLKAWPFCFRFRPDTLQHWLKRYHLCISVAMLWFLFFLHLFWNIAHQIEISLWIPIAIERCRVKNVSGTNMEHRKKERKNRKWNEKLNWFKEMERTKATQQQNGKTVGRRTQKTAMKKK